MSTQTICDGCSKPVTDPKRIGHVTPRDYCEACAALADEFQDAEELLRKNVHEEFVLNRTALIARFSADDFKLPDIA